MIEILFFKVSVLFQGTHSIGKTGKMTRKHRELKNLEKYRENTDFYAFQIYDIWGGWRPRY